MSSSVRDDDPGRQVRRGPPWVRDRRQQDGMRQLTDEAAAVARHLEREALMRSQLARSERWQADDEAEARAYEERYPAETGRGIWPPALEPVVMPPPPEEKGPGLKIIFGLVGAVGVAASIAFVLMMYAVQVPTAGNNASAGNVADIGTERTQSFAAPVLGDLTQITTAEAKVPPAEAAPAPSAPAPAPSPVGALLANTQANAIAITTPLPAAAAAPVAAAPAMPREMPRADEPTQFAYAPPAPPPVAAVPEPRPTVDPLSRGEIASLRRRGQELIAVGDIASARLILTRLSEAGDAESSFLLAGTFDAAVLASQHVVGVRADPAKAREWYTKAAAQGSLEAKQRLQQSALR